MLDPDIPPEVVEGEIDVGVAAVRPIVGDKLEAATGSSMAGFTRPPWITTIVPRSKVEAAAARDAADVEATARPTLPPSPSRFPIAKTRLHEFLPSLTTCFSWR